jgi:PAP2 superfamily
LSGAASIEVPARAPATRSLRIAVRPRARWWVEALTIAWLCWLYDATTNLAPLRVHAALANARGVLHLEHVLGLDPELTLNRWLASHHTLAVIASDYYDNAHFVVTLGLLGWVWWARADIYRPLRNALVLVNVLAFVVFWRWPVAPPRMLTSLGFSDVVSTSHAFGNFHGGALASHANELAAMPSLHMAWAAWCTLALWRASQRRWVRGLALLYPCTVVAAVIATGNHFVLDLVAGLAALALAVLLAGAPRWIAQRMRARLGERRRVAVRAGAPPELAREHGLQR